MSVSIAATASSPLAAARIDAPAPRRGTSVRVRPRGSWRSIGFTGRRLGAVSGGSVRSARQRDCGISCKAKNLSQEEFESVVSKSELPVLVDFWAEWCGPCKLVAPFVDWASEDYAGKLEVYKVDTDKSPGLVEKYKPYGLPTLIMFKNGAIVPGSRREGAITKAKLKDYLDSLLESVAA